jgi:hypothetical protein
MNLRIHIGFHKTGTTSLQRHLSKRENSNFLYVGRSYDNSILDVIVNDLAESVALFNKL